MNDCLIRLIPPLVPASAQTGTTRQRQLSEESRLSAVNFQASRAMPNAELKLTNAPRNIIHDCGPQISTKPPNANAASTAKRKWQPR